MLFSSSELTTNSCPPQYDRDSSKHDSARAVPIDDSGRKRTFQFPDLLKSHLDSSKLLFPKGVLSKIREGKEDTPEIKRIELFAKGEEDTYGIIRSLSVAFSAERSVLHIADASSGVVQVRSVHSITSTGRATRMEADFQTDTLLLKRSSETDSAPQLELAFRMKTPSITVSPRWKDRMKLSEGDCLLISSPIAEYAVPPPNV